MEENKDEILYHYTSQKGLLGIVNDDGIWATHIAYLNDSTEYNYAVNLLQEEINERFQSLSPRSTTVLLAIYPPENQTIRDFFEDSIKLIQSVEASPISVFVCSFSKEKDLLSQWRAYCPNVNGFSIGFKKSDLVKIGKNNVFELIQCEYDKNIQKSIIKQVIDKYNHELELEIKKGNSNFGAIKVSLLQKFLYLAPQLKDKAFEEEKEWRLISKPLETYDEKYFREGKSMLIPYTVISFTKKEEHIPIEHIIIGPTPHKELSKNSVSTLLKSKKINNAKIDISKIPYRAW